ncbi:Nitrilase family, member 2 [Seminavis robusta]|uniref:Nitrilase family, member 2 n=1 Tax=Seminavis robusta TaxID=568900 RepID=A0A9N8H6N4_9STRA|nr:Nitrilase family, member 2 [Seminavis robusta]|eukprot:Sro152_g069600.1 Nitrilase family, member 2 (316) ;mRNA; r:96666-97813
MVDRGHLDQQVNIRFQEEEGITINAPVRQRFMPHGFEPTEWSVICGRGRDCYDHAGNRRLRVMVEENLDKYQETKNKFQKTLIVTSIIDTVREACNNGGAFVRKDTKKGRWFEIGDEASREKIGQMLREALIRKCPQKLEAKKRKRREKTKRSSSSTASIGSAAAKVQESVSASLGDRSMSAPAAMPPMTRHQPAMQPTPLPTGPLPTGVGRFLEAQGVIPHQNDSQYYLQLERLRTASLFNAADLEPTAMREQVSHGSHNTHHSSANSSFAAAQNVARAPQVVNNIQVNNFHQMQPNNYEDLPPMVWPWMEQDN